MTATIERPQSPVSASSERPSDSKWFLALAAVVGLFVGVLLGYWWGDSRSDPTDGSGAELASPGFEALTENQMTALATIDEMIEVLNTGDLDATRGFFVGDFGWSESDGRGEWNPQADADEYFAALGDRQSAGYRFVPVETVVLGEPFGVMVDACQFLTAHREGAPPEAMVIWYRVIPESRTVVEAGFGCEG